MSIKRFDGSNWVDAPTHKRFDGSNWIDAASVKRFDGSNWIETAKNSPSPNDNIDIWHTSGYEYVTTAICLKCNHYIFKISRDTNSFTYYHPQNGDNIGLFGVAMSTYSYTPLYNAVWRILGAYGKTVRTTKEAIKAQLGAGYAYSTFDNMQYHVDGSTRNLFTSDGYLICPWCE